MQTGVFDEVEDVYNSGTSANLSMPPWGHLSFTLDFVATMAPSSVNFISRTYVPFLASSWLHLIMKLSHLRLFHCLLFSHSCTIHLVCNDKFRIQSAVSVLISMIAGWSSTSCLFSLCAALLFSWIWCTYSAAITWNLGAGLLDEATLKPDFFKARWRCFWAFCKWTVQRSGSEDFNIGFPQVIGPVCALLMT